MSAQRQVKNVATISVIEFDDGFVTTAVNGLAGTTPLTICWWMNLQWRCDLARAKREASQERPQ